ncbi:MAG: hypothetical protein AAGD10_21135 [Myxococcota bacterium]
MKPFLRAFFAISLLSGCATTPQALKDCLRRCDQASPFPEQASQFSRQTLDNDTRSNCERACYDLY